MARQALGMAGVKRLPGGVIRESKKRLILEFWKLKRWRWAGARVINSILKVRRSHVM